MKKRLLKLNNTYSLKRIYLLLIFLLLSATSFAQLTTTDSNLRDACDGLNNGSIDITVTGSTGTITLTILGPGVNLVFNPVDGAVQPVTGLIDGDYVAVGQDTNGGIDAVLFTIEKITPDLSSSLLGKTDNTDCAVQNGSIDIDVTGGTGNYSYAWTGPNGFTSTTQDISNLEGGSYSVTIFDDGTNCTSSQLAIPIANPTIAVQNITTPNAITVCPGDDIILNLDGSELNIDYEILVNGGGSGFSTIGTGAPLALTLPSGSFASTDVLTIEGTSGVCADVLMNGSVSLTVNVNSVPPTSATVDNTTYCNDVAPATITLTAVGGSLGTGATVEWYDDAGFTSSVGSGSPLVLTAPLVSTSYFVRYEGVCGNTSDQNTSVNVDIASITPTSASVDSPAYCDDAIPIPANITLSFSGGLMGTGATAEWYDDGALTNNIGTGNNLVIAAPLATSTYYVRYEGLCNMTSNQNVTVTVDNASVAPTSATVSDPTFCNDAAPANITLTAVGGSLGTAATVEWYDDAAFTNSVGSGNPLVLISPLTSTTYFTRYEGICGNTIGQSIAVNVDIASVAPTSASVDIPTYCDDAAPVNIVLTSTGGSLGTGAVERWYDDALLSSFVGLGPSLSLPAPVATTTYYVLFDGACNTTSAQNVTLTVDNASVAPTSATVSDPTYCDIAAPINITLTALGGSLGTGATAEWYDDPAFTSNVGTGSPLILASPLTSTTYFVRYENACGNTTGQSIAVVVDNASVAPTSATVDNANYCDNAIPTNIVLTSVGGSLGTGSVENWYDDALLTSFVGAGPNLTLPAPSVTTTYFVRFEGSCNTTTDQSIVVTVDDASVAPTSATVDIATYCDDAAPVNISLTVLGGSLGTGATEEWYDDPAFTNSVGSGSPLLLAAPLVSTTYFVRYENSCGNTTGQSVAVAVDNASLAPTSATVDNANYCDDAAPTNITLAGIGGSVGTGATAEWYTDAAFTISAGSGNPLVIPAPLASTTYFVRFEGTCNITADQSIAVTVDNASIAPTSATVDNANYCDDATAPANITLMAIGGSLGTGATVEWYDDPGFTNAVGSGSPLSIPAPSISTTYFVRYENSCGITTGQSVIVNVVPPPDATINGTLAACVNSVETYTVAAGEASYSWTLTGGTGAITSGAGTNSIEITWGATAGTDVLSVMVTGLAPSSCVSTTMETIGAFSSLPALTNQTTAVCQNSNFPFLVANPVPGATVTWYIGPSVTGTLVATGNSFTPTATELDLTTPGTTTYTYRQDIGCLVSTDATFDVNVEALPVAGIDNSVASCSSDLPIDLFTQLLGTPDAGGTWNDDDGSGALNIDIFDPAQSGDGSFNFTYQVDGTASCSGEISTAVVTVSVSSTSATPVPDQTLVLGCTYATPPTLTTPGVGIVWYSDAGLTSMIGSGNSFTPVDGVDIDMMAIGITSYFVTQNEGCGESSGAQIDVDLEGVSADLGLVRKTYPEQDIGAIEVLNISSNNPPFEVSLEDASMNVIYDWVALEEDRLGNYSYLFTQLAADDYVVLVRDAAGCILPISQSISLSDEVFIPNVFTPNNDGYNEFFKVLNMVPNTQIIISNRWGNKVFESDDYQNDWQAKDQSEGVYYYTIKMAGEVYQGYVEVWRNAGPAGSN